MKNESINKIANLAFEELEAGKDWDEITEKHFKVMLTKEDVEYNNTIIRAINKLLPTDGYKYFEYFGLVYNESGYLY